MKYTQYKTTEIPWVGYLPSHWKSIRNGGLFDYHQNKVGDKFNEFQLLSLTTQGIRRKNINDTFGKVPASYEGYQEVIPGDMVFCLFDLDCSAVFSGVSDYHGMITSAYDVVRPREEVVNVGFLDYWFRSVFAGRYYKIFSKSVRYTINYDVFKAIKTPVPPREEQDQIVRYLDWKVSEINHLIHGYQKQIALLKERRVAIIDHFLTNGVCKGRPMHVTKATWMGETPIDWITCRMKNLFSEINVRSVDGSEPHLTMSQKYGLITDDMVTEKRLLSENYIGAKVCQKDDLVLNRLKAHLGVFALAPLVGVVSPDYTVLRLNTKMVIPQFAEYLLKSNACRGELKTRVRGIVEGFWRLYTDDLGAIPVSIPSLEEQGEILDTILSFEEKYKKLVNNVEKEIELLREYRTCLISDVVTGQIDVRDVVIPDYQMETDNLEENADTEDMESGVNGDE